MKKSSKSVWSRFVMTFAAAFLLMLVTTVPVKADSSVPLVADMKQTDASTTSAGISWSCPGSEVRFKVEMSEQMSSGYWTYKESQSSASITLTKLGAGKVYYVRITPFKYNIEGLNKYTKVKGTTSRPLRVVTAPDSTPASLTHVKSSTDTIKVKWSAVPGADTYEVEYYIDSSKARKCVTTKTGVTLKKLAKNETYTIYVTAGRRYADGTTTAWSDNDLYKWGIPVKPSKVSGVDVTHYWQNLSEICVENSRIGCADGYQYQIYDGAKVLATQNSTNTICTLKKVPCFFARVRSYTVRNGKKIYSKWSNMMRIPSYKLKKDNIKLIKVTGREKSITAQFSKLKCSDGFDCVLKNSESGEKIIMKNQKKNTVIFKNLKPGTYYLKAHAYTLLNGIKEFGIWSDDEKVIVK